jgi:hypothetical protein
MKDYYRILGLNPKVSLKEIRERYRFLAFAYHPDRFSNSTHKKIAEQEFKEINEAYAVLSNPAKRKDYDPSWQSTFQYGQEVSAPFRRSAPYSAQPWPSKAQEKWTYNYSMALMLFITLIAVWYIVPRLPQFRSTSVNANAPAVAEESPAQLIENPVQVTAIFVTPTPSFQWVTSPDLSEIRTSDCIFADAITPKSVGKPVCVTGIVLSTHTIDGSIREISFKDASNLETMAYSVMNLDKYQGSCVSVQGIIRQYSSDYVLSVFLDNSRSTPLTERSKIVCAQSPQMN